MTSLPKVPSALIRLAINDLEKIETDPAYAVDMSYWHVPHIDTEKRRNICHVCLAGSVMANSLKCDATKEVSPSSIDPETKKILWALDSFRMGNLYEAFCYLDLIDDDKVHAFLNSKPKSIDVVPYEFSAKGFKDQMRRLADDLESNGL